MSEAREGKPLQEMGMCRPYENSLKESVSEGPKGHDFVQDQSAYSIISLWELACVLARS